MIDLWHRLIIEIFINLPLNVTEMPFSAYINTQPDAAKASPLTHFYIVSEPSSSKNLTMSPIWRALVVSALKGAQLSEFQGKVVAP
jgi:hypothetical protein